MLCFVIDGHQSFFKKKKNLVPYPIVSQPPMSWHTTKKWSELEGIWGCPYEAWFIKRIVMRKIQSIRFM